MSYNIGSVGESKNFQYISRDFPRGVGIVFRYVPPAVFARKHSTFAKCAA